MSLNPLLSKVKMPGRVFQLPSRGLFYGPGVLADSVVNAEVQVKPMSALAELKLRSADLLYSNKILDEICMECIPEIKKPNSLVSKDVDALFLFLLASTYGSNKIVKTVHGCDNGDWHEYHVDIEDIIRNPHNEALIDHTALYTVTLNNGQNVRLKPATFFDTIAILELRHRIIVKDLNNDQLKLAEMEEITISDLLSVIDYVETDPSSGEVIKIYERHLIAEWLRLISKTTMDQLLAGNKRASDWGFNFSIELTCKDCGEKFKYDLDLNPVNFFSE